MSDAEPEESAGGGGRSSMAARIFVAAGAAVALLLLGASIGLLIQVPSERSAPGPTAVDVGFSQDMSVHHDQAVTMATLARERASDVTVRQLAFDMETNQREQIGRMRGWLSLWGQQTQSAGPPMQWMRESGHGRHGSAAASGGSMPGMASTEELGRLRSLGGPDFDVEFLRLMLRHHEGGATMTQYGAEHASVPAVQQLAANMLGAQRTEGAVMRRMLAERGAQPLPPG